MSLPAPAPASDLSPSQEHQRREEFRKDLAGLLNRYSQENGSDTPDWILADHLIGCMHAWNNAIRMRDKWWGFRPWSALSTSSISPESGK